MAWPIDWNDDSVSDGSAVSTATEWNVYHGGSATATSDEHNDHSFGGSGKQVIDASTQDGSPHWMIYDDAEPSTSIKLSTYCWPDSNNSGIVAQTGLLLRMVDNTPTADADIDGYIVRIMGAGTDDEFDLELLSVTNATTTLLTSVAGLTTGTWSISKTAMLLEVEVYNNGDGNPVFTVRVDGTVEIDEYEDTSATYTSAGYSGRYLHRPTSSTHVQPFVEDFTAGELLTPVLLAESVDNGSPWVSDSWTPTPEDLVLAFTTPRGGGTTTGYTWGDPTDSDSNTYTEELLGDLQFWQDGTQFPHQTQISHTIVDDTPTATTTTFDTVSTGASHSRQVIGLVGIRGYDASDPIASSGSSSGDPNGGTIDPCSVGTLVAGNVVVCHIFTGNGSSPTGNADPTLGGQPMTQIGSIVGNSFNYQTMWFRIIDGTETDDEIDVSAWHGGTRGATIAAVQVQAAENAGGGGGGGHTVDLAAISAASTTYTLDIVKDQLIELGLISSTATVHALDVLQDKLIDLAHISSTATPHAVDVLQAKDVTLGFISSGATTYAVTVSQLGTQDINLPLLTASSQAYPLGLLQAKRIDLDLATTADEAFALEILQGKRIDLELATTSDEAYPLSILQAKQRTLEFLDSGEVVFPITVVGPAKVFGLALISPRGAIWPIVVDKRFKPPEMPNVQRTGGQIMDGYIEILRGRRRR